MRSISRVLAFGAILGLTAAPASAAWQPEKNGPFFKASAATSAPSVEKNELVSMAPKKYVAEPRAFRRYDGDGPPRSTHQGAVAPGHRAPWPR